MGSNLAHDARNYPKTPGTTPTNKLIVQELLLSWQLVLEVVILTGSLCTKWIRVTPASDALQWRLRTAARCWTRIEWSVRWGAEEETAPANTS